MIFFFYGEDSFRSRKKIRELVKEYQKVRQGGLNLIYLDFKKDRFDDFLEKIGSRPIFALKRLVVLENSLSDLGLSQKLLEYLKERRTNSDDAVLVFFETETPRADNPLFAFLKKSAKTQEFKPLSPASLASWIKTEVEGFGGEIAAPAVNRLMAIFANDLWALDNEIRKLVLLKRNRVIEDKDLVFLTGPKLEIGIFETIEAIAGNNKKTALALLNRHWEQGDSPVYLLNMISYQFRNLLLVRDLLEKKKPVFAIAKIAGLNPFVVKKCLLSAKKSSFLKLKQIYSRLLETDRQIKTGEIGPRQGLEFFVLAI